MNRLEKRLTYASIALSVASAICVGYSLLNPFEGRAYGDVTADGSVSEMPGHVRWHLWNDGYGRAGLVMILIAATLQVAAVRISSTSPNSKP